MDEKQCFQPYQTAPLRRPSKQNEGKLYANTALWARYENTLRSERITYLFIYHFWQHLSMYLSHLYINGLPSFITQHVRLLAAAFLVCNANFMQMLSTKRAIGWPQSNRRRFSPQCTTAIKFIFVSVLVKQGNSIDGMDGLNGFAHAELILRATYLQCNLIAQLGCHHCPHSPT